MGEWNAVEDNARFFRWWSFVQNLPHYLCAFAVSTNQKEIVPDAVDRKCRFSDVQGVRGLLLTLQEGENFSATVSVCT